MEPVRARYEVAPRQSTSVHIGSAQPEHHARSRFAPGPAVKEIQVVGENASTTGLGYVIKTATPATLTMFCEDEQASAEGGLGGGAARSVHPTACRWFLRRLNLWGGGSNHDLTDYGTPGNHDGE